MFEKIAWDNFEKKGDINLFLEYKRICELKNEFKCEEKNVGDNFNGFTQS